MCTNDNTFKVNTKKKIKLIINHNYVTLTQTKGRVLKWCNTSKKKKWNAKYKNLYRIGIMYNLKDKLSTE